MDFLQFLKDDKQSFSSTRLAFLSWIFAVLVAWLVTSLLPRPSDHNRQLQEIPSSVLALIGILMTGKVTQKFAENQSQTQSPATTTLVSPPATATVPAPAPATATATIG